MTGDADLAATARRIVDANPYLVLGTADRDGRPWASPVYFAHAGYRKFFWVSDPEATHSRNIAEREEVGIVVFDSTVPPGTGQGVYLHATARQLEGDERAEGIEIFSARLREHGERGWTIADVEAPAHLRLYRAVASDHSVLGERDRRVPVTL